MCNNLIVHFRIILKKIMIFNYLLNKMFILKRLTEYDCIFVGHFLLKDYYTSIFFLYSRRLFSIAVARSVSAVQEPFPC